MNSPSVARTRAHCGDEPPRPARPSPREPRKALLPVRPCLHRHRPACHPHRLEQHLAPEQRGRDQRDGDAFSGEERTIPGVQSADAQVVDFEGARQQSHGEAADRHLALQVVAAGLCCARAQGRTQIHGHRRDERHGQQDGEDGEEAQDGAAGTAHPAAPRARGRSRHRRARHRLTGSSGGWEWSVIRWSATACPPRRGRPRARAPRLRCPPAAHEARFPSSWLQPR